MLRDYIWKKNPLNRCNENTSRTTSLCHLCHPCAIGSVVLKFSQDFLLEWLVFVGDHGDKVAGMSLKDRWWDQPAVDADLLYDITEDAVERFDEYGSLWKNNVTSRSCPCFYGKGCGWNFGMQVGSNDINAVLQSGPKSPSSPSCMAATRRFKDQQGWPS